MTQILGHANFGVPGVKEILCEAKSGVGQFGPDQERTRLFLETPREGGGCLPHLLSPVLPQGNISVFVCVCVCVCVLLLLLFCVCGVCVFGAGGH